MEEEKICKICLKPYKICRVCEESYSKIIFAWRVVVCSYPCAIKYFERIENEDKANEPLNKVVESIKLNNIKSEGNIMQVLAKDGKTYDVLGVENKRAILTLKNTEKTLKIDEIVEFLYIKPENIAEIHELIEVSKKVEIKKAEVATKE